MKFLRSLLILLAILIGSTSLASAKLSCENLKQELREEKVTVKALKKLFNSGCRVKDLFGSHGYLISQDPVIVQILLDMGANPNKRNLNGKPVLFDVRKNSVAKVLLRNGARVNVLDDQLQTPLVFLQKIYGPGNEVSLITDTYIKAGADVNYMCKSKEVCGRWYASSALMEALQSGNMSAVNLLIQNGASTQKRTINGQNILHYAAEGDSLEAVKKAISFGIKIDSRDRFLYTPLHRASMGHSSGKVAIVKYL